MGLVAASEKEVSWKEQESRMQTETGFCHLQVYDLGYIPTSLGTRPVACGHSQISDNRKCEISHLEKNSLCDCFSPYLHSDVPELVTLSP